MKSFFIGLIICIINSSFLASPTASLHIEITNLRNNKGFVLVSLYNNANDFPDDAAKAVSKAKVTIADGKAIAIFENLPPGKYAAAILHDENQNLKMDFNGIGIPKEGYGFSNNAKGLFGPPAFSKAAFAFEGEKTIVIKASYFIR